MSKKKPPIFVNLLIRILVALCSLPLLALISTTNVSAATPQQYLALGDSVAFGYQPNKDYIHGYDVDLFGALQAQQGFGHLVDLGCPGETSSTFIFSKDTCLPAPHNQYSQLAATLAYLRQNTGNVGLVTLQIGANDVLPAITVNPSSPPSCTIQPNLFKISLARLDFNLKYIILPLVHLALRGSNAHLALVGYYNPFQLVCPDATPYVQELNAHLTADAGQYAQTVSIYDSFEDTNANPFLVCGLTWICDSTYHDIHPNDLGYQVIAADIYQAVYG